MRTRLFIYTFIAVFGLMTLAVLCSSPEYQVTTQSDWRENTEMRELSSLYTPQEEYYIGRSVAAVILKRFPIFNPDLAKGRIADDFTPAERYINSIGHTLVLASDRPNVYNGYRFIVLRSKSLNAFATPGGFVFITTGLITKASDEDELAGVLAHEVAHAMIKHPLESIAATQKHGVFSKLASNIAGGLAQASGLSPMQVKQLADAMEDSVDSVILNVLDGYGVIHEKEADNYAVDILCNAGYDPAGLSRMLGKLEVGGGTHGDPHERANFVDSKIDIMPYVPATYAERKARFDLYTAELQGQF